MPMPYLNEMAPLPGHRYIPETYDAYIAAVYVVWNLLDGIIYHEMKGHKRPFVPLGYMRKVQLHGYSKLVWKNDNVHTYCETGVNGGHGTAAMLLANPRLVAHSFDPGEQPYSEGVFKVLHWYFGDRWVLHRGDSHALLPSFLNPSTRGRCDLILVDGDHSHTGAFKDIVDFHPLAACNANILLDDIRETWNHQNGGPQHAIAQAEALGKIRVVERHVYNRTSAGNPCLRSKDNPKITHCFYPWGWAIARYNRQGATCQISDDGGPAPLNRHIRARGTGDDGKLTPED